MSSSCNSSRIFVVASTDSYVALPICFNTVRFRIVLDQDVYMAWSVSIDIEEHRRSISHQFFVVVSVKSRPCWTGTNLVCAKIRSTDTAKEVVPRCVHIQPEADVWAGYLCYLDSV